MTAVERTNLKSRIKARINALRESADVAREELRASGAMENAHVDALDFAKGSTDLSTLVDLLNRNTREEVVLTAALIRMDSPTCGLCLACGDGISPRRLYAHPAAYLCVSCQEDMELSGLALPSHQTSGAVA